MLQNRILLAVIIISLVGGPLSPVSAADAKRGYQLLVQKAFLPHEFDERTFENTWKIWPEPLRSQAKKATPAERRNMAFARYGLTVRPSDDSGKPLQYVVDEQGKWTMNCFSCHGGEVAGQVIPGLPNARYAMQTLYEDTRATKLLLGTKPWGKELTSIFFPLGGSRGTTNAVMFGVALKAFRDDDLNIVIDRPIPKLVHHDMDAPPWWHYRKKNRLYIDGFAEKGHRALMPFLMVKENGPKKFPKWEDDFRDIAAYLESLEAPRYPFKIDKQLAVAGEQVFNKTCAECHGTYGENETYPQRIVPIDEVATDRVRLGALSREHRHSYGLSWFAYYGKQETIDRPEGYLAPPLDGIWASAPYFHNGSVPTLWHVLHPDQRPQVWRFIDRDYDQDNVGLDVTTLDRVPREARKPQQRREYFNTRLYGKSASGHEFPAKLSETEKQSLLEYLKTL